MSGPTPETDGPWRVEDLPRNVRVGENVVINGKFAFRRFMSRRDPALLIGSHCTMDEVQFAVGPGGYAEVGEYSYFMNAVLLCEVEVKIGRYVVIGFNSVITDSDFHPIAPAERVADALALSPLGKGRPRPTIPCKPVVIEDDVWIGPSVTVLKGVRIGAGAFIEGGSLITRDVPPRARVLGNPAQVIGTV